MTLPFSSLFLPSYTECQYPLRPAKGKSISYLLLEAPLEAMHSTFLAQRYVTCYIPLFSLWPTLVWTTANSWALLLMVQCSCSQACNEQLLLYYVGLSRKTHIFSLCFS